MTKNNQQILQLAIPSIVSNITVPLLGLVDTAIVGHMGEASFIAAIAIGSMVFNVTYWLFAFLRMGTGGLTAQAFGRGDNEETMLTLARSLTLSSLSGITIIVFQIPIYAFVLWIIAPEQSLLSLVWQYIHICVWGAPAMLGLFALNGWFVGMQNTRVPMYISITQNIVNILASLIFVYIFGMKIEGVAFGTLIAQWSGFGMGILCTRKFSRGTKQSAPTLSFATIRRFMPDLRFFTVNRDIFLRTLFLVSVNLYFVAAGAKGGDIILAVNTLLMQLFILYSYVMDGFAYAAEALCGRYYGAKDSDSLRLSIKNVFIWSLGLTTLYTLLYIIGGQSFLHLLTDNASVVEASADYLPWAWLIPFAGMTAFVWDGIFIGMTLTRGMLMGTGTAATVFFITYFALSPTLANHALWLAFILYLLVRGITQTVYYKKTPPSLPKGRS